MEHLPRKAARLQPLLVQHGRGRCGLEDHDHVTVLGRQDDVRLAADSWRVMLEALATALENAETPRR